MNNTLQPATPALPDRPAGAGLQSIAQRARRWRKFPVFSAFILLLLVFAAVAAPVLAPYPATHGQLRSRHSEPAILGGESDHILGADNVGRDIYSRLLYGARVSLLVAAGTILIAGTFGTLLGLISGWYGGWVDEAIMRLVDAMNAIPIILVALVFAVVFGPSFALLLGVLALGQWPQFARQVRAEALSLRERDYVQLARVAGASTPRILWKHILPGVFSTVIVVATNQVGTVILSEAGLSFLGVGVPPPTPSWGGMIAEGRLYLTEAWWISAFPGLAIALTVLSLVFMGDWLRDRLDPTLRQLE
jgi:peptide/nickel transport system permease protein